MKVIPHNQFLVRINYSQRLTRRNRRFIERVNEHEDNVSHQPPDCPKRFQINRMMSKMIRQMKLI